MPAGGKEKGGGPGRIDPDVAYSFYVEIDGIRSASFAEVHGLEWKADTVSFYEGGNPRHKVNLVGQGNFTPLVLKKGFMSASGEFFNWMKAVMNPNRQPMERSSISVVVCNRAGEEVGRYNIFGAFVTRYAGPEFNAGQSAIGFEEIEVAYDYFEYQAAGGAPGK